MLNTSSTSRRIRASIPGAPEFTLKYDKLRGIMPGGELLIEVEYFAELKEESTNSSPLSTSLSPAAKTSSNLESGPVHTSFTVETEGDRVVIPLVAEVARTDVKLQPFCSFGQVCKPR